MKQIRKGVFETNSSSVHTITICTEDEYQRYLDGELLVVRYKYMLDGTAYKGRRMVTREEAEEIENKMYGSLTLEQLEDNIRDDFESYDVEDDYYCYEQYAEHFTTPSGDKMVAFGEYGYDG